MKAGFEASKCIDGTTNGPDATDLCQTKPEMAPWLAISFGKLKLVSVEKITIFNVLKYTKDSGKTNDLTIRVVDELPKSAGEMFKGGVNLLGRRGLVPEGKNITLVSYPGWETKLGRYVVIQMDNSKSFPFARKPLNLKEVVVYGKTQVTGIYHGVANSQIFQYIYK